MPKEKYSTQNNLLMNKMLEFYGKDNNIEKILPIINGESVISLRLIDWFVTNYSKKNYTVLKIKNLKGEEKRFKVYYDYKLRLKAYSKKRFDPFCRWERINIPYKNDTSIQTTLGQLNFFKWALDNKIIDYIKKNTDLINSDMNKRNSTSKNMKKQAKNTKTRKKREELSISASKSIKKEKVEIVVKFE